MFANENVCISIRISLQFISEGPLHNGLHKKFELNVFPIFIGFEFGLYRLYIVPNLKCMHAVFATL